MNEKPSAELISHTKDPLGTLFCIWQQSRTNAEINSPDAYELAFKYPEQEFDDLYLKWGGITTKQVRDTVKQLISEDVPVTECIHFTFMLRNIPVSLREQLVRHRIGVQVGPLQGLDQIPELGASTFWSQTSRMVSQSDFFDENRYTIPDSIQDDPPDTSVSGRERLHKYTLHMRRTQETYNELISMGVPMEDARQVLPLAATQTMTWTLSLKSLTHIIGKRACWIAQLGLWGPLITSMINEMCGKVSPLFRSIVSPPCISRGKYTSCPIELVNKARMSGEDPYPACPIYTSHLKEGEEGFEHPYWDRIQSDTDSIDTRLQVMRQEFEQAWHLSSETGLPLSPTEHG